jgi:hypothetical protein
MRTRGRYTIVLFRYGGEAGGVESVLVSDDRLDAARALYRRVVMRGRQLRRPKQKRPRLGFGASPLGAGHLALNT